MPSFEDLVENFWRIMRFISDNGESFTASTSRIRIRENFNLLTTHYPNYIRQRFQNVLHPSTPPVHNAEPPQNPMEIYRLPTGTTTLQTGFAYVDRAHIPFTGAAADTDAAAPMTLLLLEQPGFAPAFNRALNNIDLQHQLSRFFAQIPNGAIATMVPDNDDTTLENTGEDEIPEGSVCGFYPGFLTKCDTFSNSSSMPSDRKIQHTVTFTSFGNPRRLPSNTGRGTGRIPPPTRTVEQLTLIGWNGRMMEMVPVNIRPTAGMASHSCDPNSFLHVADSPDGEDDDSRETKSQFSVSGTFDLHHSVRTKAGREVSYDKVKFEFKPWFLHTKVRIPVGGRFCIDYGPNIVDYSDFHIHRESRRLRRNNRVKLEVLRKNDANRVRLIDTGISPMDCRSQCCDEAEEANFGRSRLYFDGQVSDIDYDKLKDMFFGSSSTTTATTQPNATTTQPSANKRRLEEEVEEELEGVTYLNQPSPQTDRDRAKKRAKSAPPAFDSMQGRMEFVRDCLQVNMSASESMMEALTAVGQHGEPEENHAEVPISDMQDMPPYPSPVAAPDDDIMLSAAVFPPAPVAAAVDDDEGVLPAELQQQPPEIPSQEEEEPDPAVRDFLLRPRDDGILSLLITWAYALFNLVVTAYYTSNAVRACIFLRICIPHRDKFRI